MAHYEPFQALGPIDWSTVEEHQKKGSLPALLDPIFTDAQTLIASVPEVGEPKRQEQQQQQQQQQHTRPRSTTAPADTSASQDGNQPDGSGADLRAQRLIRFWKDVRTPNENPHGIRVYRMAPPRGDGGGSWFARRSVHRGIAFERWRDGLLGEFDETIRRVESDPKAVPGTGNIRGVGAEKKVEDVEVDERRRLQVYHVSARLASPATPRDFVTLLITSQPPDDDSESREPRQLILVSKPCVHPSCPQRPGFIRAQYESVEIVREMPATKPLRSVRSSVDLRAAAAGKTAGDASSGKQKPAPSAGDETTIEWIMITRSDPGGNVPRFMVDRATPSGIIHDAGKFVDWLSEGPSRGRPAAPASVTEGGPGEDSTMAAPAADGAQAAAATSEHADDDAPTPPASRPSGLYGLLASALEAANSMIIGSLPGPFTGTDEPLSMSEDEESGDDDDGTSSSLSSHQGSVSAAEAHAAGSSTRSASPAADSPSARSGGSTAAGGAPALSKHDKELRKLAEQHRKAREKTLRAQERAAAQLASKQRSGTAGGRGGGDDEDKSNSNSGDAEQRAQATRDKYQRALAKQEARYLREVRRLEAKRAASERRAEEKRRKAAEREEKARLRRELETARAERDAAARRVSLLAGQVGELQAQNTRLVALLGRLGVSGAALDAEGGGAAPSASS